MGENEESAGEDLIAEFLEAKGILFKRYPELPKLNEDSKSFRKPDFYLTQYGVYLEFLGQWNNSEHRQRYREKMAVYHKNNIPCVYLWPDNLGTLDWSLRRRLREVLLKYNKKWSLFKYEWSNYTVEYGLLLIGIGVLIYFVKDNRWRIAIGVYLLYTIYYSVNKYVQCLRKIKKTKWGSDLNYNREN